MYGPMQIKDNCSKNMERNILIAGKPDMVGQQVFSWKGFKKIARYVSHNLVCISIIMQSNDHNE